MIMNEPLFTNFCKERNLSPGSIEVYRHALKKYVEYNNMTLQELLTEADTEEEQRIRWKQRTLKHHLIDFRNHLINEGYAKETISGIMRRVLTFYRHHEIEIHHLPRVNIQSVVEIRLPTRDDLQAAIDSSKPLMKAIILFLATTGMSKVDMLKLTIDDFITATGPYHNTNNINKAMNILKDTSNVVPTFALTRTKTNKFHYTFCTPEAVTSIVNYLYSRKDKLTPESPLFKVSYQHLTIKFEHLNEALNLGVTMGNSYAVLRCHTLRKYHATTLRDDGLSIDIINSLQGKTKNKVDRAYYVDTPEKLKEMYMDHMNSLAVGDEYRFRTKMETISEENKKLKERDDELRSRMALIEEKLFEIDRQDNSREDILRHFGEKLQ